MSRMTMILSALGSRSCGPRVRVGGVGGEGLGSRSCGHARSGYRQRRVAKAAFVQERVWVGRWRAESGAGRAAAWVDGGWPSPSGTPTSDPEEASASPTNPSLTRPPRLASTQSTHSCGPDARIHSPRPQPHPFRPFSTRLRPSSTPLGPHSPAPSPARLGARRTAHPSPGAIRRPRAPSTATP
eukprot:6602861-Prymnesium_polylepis.2